MSKRRILVYKRTHTGDPSEEGVFGVYDCMGSVRDLEFDAVIGVGGIGAEPRNYGISGRVTWIGIGPKKHRGRGRRGPLVSFDHFVSYDSTGPELESVAPTLASRLYGPHGPRYLIKGMSDAEYVEAAKILRRAAKAPPSVGLRKKRPSAQVNRRCECPTTANR